MGMKPRRSVRITHPSTPVNPISPGVLSFTQQKGRGCDLSPAPGFEDRERRDTMGHE
jgi:hypothetical protein